MVEGPLCVHGLGTSPPIRTQTPANSRTSQLWLFTMMFTSLLLSPMADFLKRGRDVLAQRRVCGVQGVLLGEQLLVLNVPTAGVTDECARTVGAVAHAACAWLSLQPLEQLLDAPLDRVQRVQECRGLPPAA